MAEIEQIEYALLIDGEAVDWFQDRGEAIGAAQAKNGQVQESITYCTARRIVWPEHADCDVCGDEHPVGALEDGLCPSCCDEHGG